VLTHSVLPARSVRPLPAALASQRVAPTHATPSGTVSTTSAEEHRLLAAQRKNRPLAPHLSIYQPQLTWYGSAANRITGVALAGLIYAYFVGYGVGLPGLDVATLAASFGALPWPAKIAAKLGIALPFAYHSLNSLRHLCWDMAKLLDIKDVYRTGYAVLALTAVGTVWLVSK